ncbi:MAG: HYR domain-containing protein [Deferrisomatales bacterium]|nr:HYR domain-containing protein [Deferrisomatales bacterium]
MTPAFSVILRLFAAAFALVCGLSLPAAAATDQWRPYPPGVGGPWGGWVRQVIEPDAAGGELWVATGGGVFRSLDGGDTWEPRSAGLQSPDVTDIAACGGADPALRILIAGTDSAGLHLSSDGGATWSQVDPFAISVNSAPRFNFPLVGVNPTDCSRLTTVTYDHNGLNGHLFQSLNGGVTWVDRGSLEASALAYASDGVLFLATRTAAFFRQDLASPVPVYLSSLVSSSAVVGLELPWGDGSVLVAAQGGAGLWVSESGGAFGSWVRRYLPAEYLDVDAVAADRDPGGSGRILFHVNDQLQLVQKALYESLDLGVTPPTPVGLPEPGMEVTALCIGASADWVGELNAGLFRRAPGAGAFAHSSVGMAAYSVRDLSFGATAADLAVAGGEPGGDGNGGIPVWDSAPSDWLRRQIDLAPYPTQLVRWQDGDLWAGVSGLFWSPDRGATWEERRQGLSSTDRRMLSDLGFALADPWVAVLATGGGMYQTADAGLNWAKVDAGQVPPNGGWRVARDRAEAKGFFAAGKQGNAGLFFWTADPASTWEERAAGVFAGKQIVSLEVSTQIDDHAFVGTALGGAFESFDGGLQWLPVGDGFTGFPPTGEVSLLALAEYPGDLVMAGYVSGTVYVTRDGGATWNPAPGAGLNWVPAISAGVSALAFEPGLTRLVAGLSGRGLWYLDIDVSPPSVTATPPGGVYSFAQTVGLAAVDDFDPAPAIYYSLDGTAPTLVYSAPVAVNSSATLRYRARDAAGNESPVGAQTYTVVGVAITTYVTPTGQTTQTVAGTMDAGVTVSVSVSPAGAGVDPVTYPTATTWSVGLADLSEGSNQITATATDGVGNAASTTVVVTVDITAPVVTAPLAVSVEAMGPQTDVAIGSATATDAMGVVSLTSDAPATFPVGTTVVTWTATDAVGNAGTATQEVTVTDTTAPAVTAPSAVSVEATGPQTDVAIGSATATDAVGVVSLTSDAPATFPVGTAVVTWTATDAAGNAGTATQEVTVTDTTAPAVTAPSAVSVEATGPQTDVAIGSATATDAVGVVSLTSDAPATFPVGTAVVTWTATDAAGNAGTATQEVTVTDTADTVPPTVSASPEGGLYGAAQTVRLAAVDDQDPAPAILYSLDGTAPSLAYNGPVTVTASATLRYRARDAAGNESPVGQQVYTIDTLAPTLAVRGPDPYRQLQWDDYAEPGATATDGVAGDLTAAIAIDASAVDVTRAGTYTVRYTVSDGVRTTGATRTVIVLADANRNGVADGDEYPDPAADTNGDGTPDAAQGITVVTAAVASQPPLGIRVADGITLAGLSAVAPASLPAAVLPEEELPYGLFAFRLEGVALGGDATVTFYLPVVVTGTARWYKVDGSLATGAFLAADRVSAAGNAVTIRLTDGGAGDGDGVVNGVIVDPGGPVVTAAVPPPPEPGGGGGGGGGGCFLSLLGGDR